MRKAQEGKIVGTGEASYGFYYADDHYHVDPDLMPFVQEIFEMVADGHSIYEVAQHLRRKGTPSPGGAIGSWGRTPIRNIILSDTYLGTFWWGKENLAGRIKKLETKLDRVRDLFIDGNLPRPAYEEKKSLIRDEIDAVRTELAKVDDLDA